MNYHHYYKRDPIKNYFPLPNEIFSLGLSFGEIAVYAYLMYCEDRKIFQCSPSYSTIGRAIGMSRNTVAKYVRGNLRESSSSSQSRPESAPKTDELTTEISSTPFARYRTQLIIFMSVRG